MSASGPFQDKPILNVKALSVARGARVLFEDLSFAATPGAYVEVRGANGAGKTSLLRAIAGFLRPRSGTAVVANVSEPALALHFIGHLNALKPTASVRAHLHYWAGLFGVGGDEAAALERLSLTRQRDLPVRVLSQGQARRLALSRLLIAPRPVWLLDEPAAALDTQGRDLLAGLIEAHCAQGGIALAAVHEPLGPAPRDIVTIGE